MQTDKNLRGFTIVELLVVIVVIGILATITIVSYTGISSKANIASLSSDLTNASTQLKMFNVDNSNYPSTISTDCIAQPDTTTNKCLKPSANTVYTYKSSSANHNIFCLEAIKSSNTTYSITQEGQLLAGPCPILNLDASSSLSYPGAGNSKWYDLSGNDNNGTLNGGVAYNAGNGGALSFDGVNGYVDTNVDFSWNITDSFSMSAWVKGSAESGRVNSIISKVGYEYSYYTVDNKIGFNYWNSVGSDTITIEAGVASIAQWHFAVVTYDGSVGRLYIDGLLMAIDSSCSGTLNNSTETTKVGNGYYAWKGSNGYFKGTLGEVYIHRSKALSSDEILQNFNATKGRYGL